MLSIEMTDNGEELMQPANQSSSQSDRQPAAIIHELRDAHLNYRIITADEEIIHRSAAQLARACTIAVTAEVWTDNFFKMVAYLQQWANARRERVAEILVELCNDKVVFFVVPKSDTFDFDLSFEQSEVDIYLNSRGNIGYAETRQVPAWDRDSFISSNARFVWVPDMQTAPPAGN